MQQVHCHGDGCHPDDAGPAVNKTIGDNQLEYIRSLLVAIEEGSGSIRILKINLWTL